MDVLVHLYTIKKFADVPQTQLTIRVQQAHTLGLARIERAYLYLMFEYRAGVFLEEHLVNSHVESRNYFLRVVYQLVI